MVTGPAFAGMCAGLRLGSPLGVSAAVKTLTRPQWLFGSAGIPRRPVTFIEPAGQTDADIQLCRRIMRAYRAACDGDGDDGTGELSPIWEGKTKRYYRALESALLAEDPEALNEQLRWLFRRPFLAGISTPIDYEDPAAPRYWALMTYDTLVSLAEAVGVIKAECPEQGVAGRAFAEGIDTLPGRIESALGISLDYPRVGAPYGILIGERLITRELGRHLYAAVRLREAITTHLRRPVEDIKVVEVGGGFGGAALWYLRLLPVGAGHYTIVDLPLMNAFQAYFLGQVYGAGAVALYGESSAGAHIHLLPPKALDTDALLRPDVVFNEDSMPEMTESVARGYLRWMRDRCSGLFVSCNQEAATPVDGIPQLVVGELVARIDGLRRVSRHYSWVRRGYVEEIYSCSSVPLSASPPDRPLLGAPAA